MTTLPSERGSITPQVAREELPQRPGSWRSSRDWRWFTVATVVAAIHTVDEIRIGEFIAVPFALVNVALVVAWPRLGRLVRAAVALGFGLFWALAVIPYHVLPLLEGLATWQHVSGLSRVVGGTLMAAVGVSILLGRDRGERPEAGWL